MCAGKLRLFDDLVGEREKIIGEIEAERLRSLEVDHQLELARPLNR